MTNKRIIEIDFLKTIAIIMMVIFHIIYDLNVFVGLPLNYQTGFWYWIGKIAAILFILLAGINSGFCKKPIKRGLIVLGCGILVTLVTYIFLRGEYVRFGILHFLGISMLLVPFLKRLKNWLLLLLALSIVIYSNLKITLISKISILLFGNIFSGKSIDYYPLFPYLALFIIGIVIYKSFYYQKKSIFNITLENKIITVISKHSLLIYLIHQPIILAIIFLLKFLIKG